MTKTQVALSLVRGKKNEAIRAARIVQNVAQSIEADLLKRQQLGEDPRMDKLPGLYTALKAAVDTFNATSIEFPTQEEVAALIGAADSAEVAVAEEAPADNGDAIDINEPTP